MTTPDVYVNALNRVMVVAPTAAGRLGPVAARRTVELERDSGEIGRTLARWIFADFDKATLRDQWGNPYDHQVHTLVVGTFAHGEAYVSALRHAGFVVEQADQLFVPFQRIDLHSEEDSDQLRLRHPRAFALALRHLPPVDALVVDARDRGALGS